MKCSSSKGSSGPFLGNLAFLWVPSIGDDKQPSNGIYALASETCSLDPIRAHSIREIQLGKVIVVEMHQEGEAHFSVSHAVKGWQREFLSNVM